MRHRRRDAIALGVALLALLLVVVGAGAQTPPPSVWPTLHGGAARASVAAARGPSRPSLFWRLPFVQHANVLFRSPISTGDGQLLTTLFASTPGRGGEAFMLGARPDGPVQTLGQAAMFGDPVIGPGGDLYVLAVGDDGYLLLVLPAEGEVEPLLLPPARPAFNSPVIGPDGSVYLALNGLVLGLTAAAEPRWVWTHPQLGDPLGQPPTVVGSPALGPEGTLVAVFQDGIYAFETGAGRLLWRSSYQFVDQDQPVDGPIIGPDGTIYAITRAPAPPNETEGESFLYSLRPNGALNWRWPAGRGAIHHPAIDRDGTLYLPVTNIQRADLSVVGHLHALNPDSSLLRPSLERREEQGMIEAVVLDNTGQLYAIAPLTSETLILGLRPDGSELFPPTPVPGRLRGPLGVPLPGMISAFGDRALALLADGPVLELTLAVDLPAAAPGGVLTYTIRARNTGVLPATNLLLLAGAPTLARYAPDSTVLDGLPVADLSEDAPVQTGVNIGLLPPGAEAVLTFRMNLQRASTGAMITNRATARCDQLGTHVSNTVTTRIN